MAAGVATVVDEFVARIPTHSCALSFDGPAGIGKTYHWTAVVENATGRGWRLLQIKPEEAGFRLGGTGLIDLLGEVTDDEIASLVPPQRRALASALLRATVGAGPAPDAQVVVAAVTSLVARFAADGPVVIAIDDVQWLDPATATALTFLARHLPDSNVGIVMTLRTPSAEPTLLTELDASWALRRVAVPPLDENEIADLVRSRLAFPIPPSVLSRAAAASGGNPFYGVQLAQIWAGETGESSESLTVPQSLMSLLGSRLDALPARCRLALAAASAIGRASIAELNALELDEALAPAERAGVVSVRGGTVHFAHPLLAAAAYNDLSSDDRARLHLRVAEVVADVEHRARHLALGSPSADERVAVLLDDVARRAEYRADINAAVDAATLAVRMTPVEQPDQKRRFALGRLLHKLGDVRAAQAELEAATGPEGPRRTRVRALILLCELAFATISHSAAEKYARAALDAAVPAEDDDLIADAHLYLAQVLDASSEVRAHAERALDLIAAGAHPNPAGHAYAIALIAALDFFAGSRFDAAPFERALDVEQTGGVLAEESMMGYYVAVLAFADEIPAGLNLVDRWQQRCADEGCESQQPFILMWRSYFLLADGRLDEAESVINRHIALGERLGQDYNVNFGRLNLGRLALSRGAIATAREIGESLTQSAVTLGAGLLETRARRLAGDAALCDGDSAAAVEHLNRVEQLRDKGHNELYASGHLAHLAEALAGLGRTSEADEVLAQFEDLVRSFDSTPSRAIAARTRGLIAASRSDDAVALGALDVAIELFDKHQVFPFESARTLLVKGQLLRRLRRKALAKDALAHARLAFVAMGSHGWVERVDDELTRIGLRPPAPAHLTPTERKVIESLVAGRSTKDIAASLFVSPRTVEGHLVRIYRKIGVRTRVELIAKHASGGIPSDPAGDA